MDKDFVAFECVHVTETDSNNPDEKHALAYADIDGYSANEDEGGVVCRVWLLSQPVDDKNTKGFLVDWHYNCYRNNKAVKEEIEFAKNELLTFSGSLLDNVIEKAYHRYQLNWMLEHDHTIQELVGKLESHMEILGAETASEAFDQMQENGFGGELWVCYDEFRSAEAQDKDVMRSLLKDDEYELWENFMDEIHE